MNKELIQQTNTLRRVIVETAVKELLVAANKVTPLETTTLLKKKVGQFHWTKDNVGEVLEQIASSGKLTSEDKGSYKIYSVVKGVKLGAEDKLKVEDIKKSNISRTDALKLIQNNKGHFFTATFVNKEDELRTINAQYLKDSDTKLGYVKVRETSKMGKGENPIRNINLQTLEELRIGGKTFKVG